MAKLYQTSQPLIAIAIIKGFGSGAIAPIPPEVIAIAATRFEAAITATKHRSIATTADYEQEAIVTDFRVVTATVFAGATTVGKQGSSAVAETPKTDVFGSPTAAATHIAIAITSQLT